MQVAFEHNSRRTTFDQVILFGVMACGLCAFVIILVAPKFLFPAEDAAILFQFSRNLAHTGAITYFANGPHAEGATDFAWMILIAAGFILHIPPMWSVAAINGASLLGISLLLTKIAQEKVDWLIVLFTAGAFALLPQFFAALVGFSVLPFAFLILLVASYFLRQSFSKLALSCLALCLFRPDGVVFAVPMMCASCFLYQKRREQLTSFAGLFLLPGGLYFLWRWHYFGTLFPLPFLVKSDVHRVFHLFVLETFQQGLLLCLFSWAITWIAFRKRRLVHGATLALTICLLVLPNLFYLRMRLDQNVGHRFFVYLPLGTAALIAANWQSIRAQRWYLIRVSAALWIFFVSVMYLSALNMLDLHQYDGRVAIATDLSSLGRGTVLPTEAGIIPYYSGWIAYDPWGLNTRDFAAHLIQPSDIKRLRPDLIEIHPDQPLDCASPFDPGTPYKERTWIHMKHNITAGIDYANYDLWYTPFGNTRRRERRHYRPWDREQECWLIRRDSSLHDGIQRILEDHQGESEADYAAKQTATPSTSTGSATHPDSGWSPVHMARNFWQLLSFGE
jgi:hypothetical protein